MKLQVACAQRLCLLPLLGFQAVAGSLRQHGVHAVAGNAPWVLGLCSDAHLIYCLIRTVTVCAAIVVDQRAVSHAGPACRRLLPVVVVVTVVVFSSLSLCLRCSAAMDIHRVDSYHCFPAKLAFQEGIPLSGITVTVMWQQQ